MRQLVVLSGKGGTGKTTVTAALASLASSKVMADCDVDAANMYLLLEPELLRRETFEGGCSARIDPGLCDSCGICRDLCRFEAIDETFRIDAVSCEGCGVCVWNCPQQAISLKPDRSGEWYVSQTRLGPLVHARLGVAQENSGKLVSIIREEAKRIAQKDSMDYVLIDGPPGVSCPAMASLTGTDAALIVTEPTRSGLHDLRRAAELLRAFKVPGLVCINKYDLNPEQASAIRDACKEMRLELVGEMPFDPTVPKSQIAGHTLVEHSEGRLATCINEIWDRTRRRIWKKDE